MSSAGSIADGGESRDREVTFCSVVIPTHNRESKLRRALSSVAALDYPAFETLVVDNSPGDDRVCALAESFGARRVVEPRIGVSFARNRGAAQARGEIVAFLDDDVAAEPGWLGALVAEFHDPRVIGVSGPYLPLGPTIYEGLYNPGRARRVIDLSTPSWFELAAFDCPARGGNMAIRVAALESWSGFVAELGRGTALGMGVKGCGSEDSYATVALVERGYRFVYTPGAVVRHELPGDLVELRSMHWRHLTERGQYLGFLFAHGYRRQVLRHLMSKAGGRRVRKSPAAGAPFPLKVSAAEELLALLKGVALFIRVELARKQKLRQLLPPR